MYDDKGTSECQESKSTEARTADADWAYGQLYPSEKHGPRCAIPPDKAASLIFTVPSPCWTHVHTPLGSPSSAYSAGSALSSSDMATGSDVQLLRTEGHDVNSRWSGSSAVGGVTGKLKPPPKPPPPKPPPPNPPPPEAAPPVPTVGALGRAAELLAPPLLSALLPSVRPAPSRASADRLQHRMIRE